MSRDDAERAVESLRRRLWDDASLRLPLTRGGAVDLRTFRFAVAGTRLTVHGLEDWCRQLRYEASRYLLSRPQQGRVLSLLRCLTIEAVRVSDDVEGLRAVEAVLACRDSDAARYVRRCWTRRRRGDLLVEVRNRIGLLATGRKEYRVKNARFALDRIPASALDRLIQSHPDMQLVERMRAERVRRQVEAA